jgi:tungstate transport system substrate-binding protein
MVSAKRSLGILIALCVLLLPWAALAESLMMATTTSTDNTGLLEALAPRFEEDTGITLKWTAVGTGKALEIGRNCDVDLLFVHAPEAEKDYLANGYGVDRTKVMYNDFVLIGPSGDPAGIMGMNAEAALQRIRREKATFVSRGDNSGTNKKELSLWEKAGVDAPDRKEWYLETGQGMLATIRVAGEKDAYTLTDRGTYIKYAAGREDAPLLEILVEDDPGLFNQYSVIAVNPQHCASAKYELAKRFTDWITSADTQAFIGGFELMGKTLFTPNAGE